MQPNSFQAKVH